MEKISSFTLLLQIYPFSRLCIIRLKLEKENDGSYVSSLQVMLVILMRSEFYV